MRHDHDGSVVILCVNCHIAEDVAGQQWPRDGDVIAISAIELSRGRWRR